MSWPGGAVTRRASSFTIAYVLVDSEQIASCLNIGARLAEEEGFPVSRDNEFGCWGRLSRTRMVVLTKGLTSAELRLSDKSVEQRLFGFQFG